MDSCNFCTILFKINMLKHQQGKNLFCALRKGLINNLAVKGAFGKIDHNRMEFYGTFLSNVVQCKTRVLYLNKTNYTGMRG